MVVGVVTELTVARRDVTEAVGDADDTLSDSVADDAGDDAAEGVLAIAAMCTVIIQTASVKKCSRFPYDVLVDRIGRRTTFRLTAFACQCAWVTAIFKQVISKDVLEEALDLTRVVLKEDSWFRDSNFFSWKKPTRYGNS